MTMALGGLFIVVIIPPDTICGPIQQIRQKHDKAYNRWYGTLSELNLEVLDC
jgi:hypothetical protein